MNILEALRAKRAIRRVGQKVWIDVDYIPAWLLSAHISIDALLEDYEVRDDPVGITTRQFWDVYKEVVDLYVKRKGMYGDITPMPAYEMIGELAKKLGL